MDKPKRKRLAKACDGCHKSKRRCDGTDPCSNCYFASKPCTYTDSSGRPVPPPRQPDTQQTQQYQFPQPAQSYPSPSGRKRSHSEAAPETLDPLMTRELTNLFFTHCHPAMTIIHKPTFTSSLSHNQIPPYLLHAVSAVAAPHSKQTSLKTAPQRHAGRRFADAAISLMFDSGGRLTASATVQTAQALCLLYFYEVVDQKGYMSDTTRKDKSHSGWITGERFRTLTLQLIQALNVHTPEHPLLTPTPSQVYVSESLERECVRRIFWIIYFVDCIRGVYYGWEGGGMTRSSPSGKGLSIGGGVMGFSEAELRLRLPADETSFELGVVHQSLPEYLYLPAVRTHYASEMGHLTRIATLYQKIEAAMDTLHDPQTRDILMECQKFLDEWASALPTHLHFTNQCLTVQKSMFETSSNFGAWCYACIHVLHASCALALLVAKQRFAEQDHQPFEVPDFSFITDRIYAVMEMLGCRAKYSPIQGSVIWPLIKYLNLTDDQQVLDWLDAYEELTGVRLDRLIRDRWGTPDVCSTLGLIRRQGPSGSTTYSTPKPDRHTNPDIDPTLLPLAERNNSAELPIPMYASSSHPTAPQSPSTNSHSHSNYLPSLKSSGLLEWSNTTPSTSTSPLAAPLERRPFSGADTARSMPVGMPWLANESR
ncbi:hypothetical protein F5146DRAFT_1032915 [Armillaria mellea]|nr:hypothetical protein F5146DRAFT_1032915 [Armillaria mellea]